MIWLIRWLMGRQFTALALLQGHTVVISGCDTGFGHETTLNLLALGINVCAGCYTDKGIQDLSEIASKCKGILLALKLDVTNQESVADFYSRASEFSPNGIYALINNAGVASALPFEILSFESHQRIMDVNYFGSLRMMRAFTPLLRKFSQKQKGRPNRIHPRIITIGSIAGRVPIPLLSAYSASKHAVRVLTEIARVELAAFGIKAIVIEPAFAATPIVLTDQSENHNAEFEEAPEEAKIAYGTPTIQERREKLRKVGTDPLIMKSRQVVNVIVNAVRIASPADRYVVGLAGYVIIALKAILPWWIVDWIFLSENGKMDFGQNAHLY
ncbi:UNVERIFIED_CONTAM: hypothetical protein HDU68_011579 [Siphonaria sp. JEL0065]|nr:hypothetical protein HDU68_011579 [Siphonaria sp. JEL0065]